MTLKEKAQKKLTEAYKEVENLSDAPLCDYKDFIDFVIDNKHLTYKYVLFTAILSKSADESINGLCLQAGSELTGAYDARTVCHQVIVPFEMETLEKALGGSNEPFLNKPARYTELSTDNAVRRGNDEKILHSLINNIPLIDTSDKAYSCLKYLLYKLIKIKEKKKAITVFSIPDSANLPSKLMTFINRALEQSYEGEILTLMIAGIYHLHYNKPSALVEVHPVNQCGASGREVSDLDIYVDGKLVASNELKDKDYAETDVRHAADKVLSAGGTKMLFIEGPRANAQGAFKKAIESEYGNKNFLLRILAYNLFLDSYIGTLEDSDCEEFVRFILETARETKFKEEVISYLDNLAKEIFGLSR
jgi:hypothetical protein